MIRSRISTSEIDALDDVQPKIPAVFSKFLVPFAAYAIMFEVGITTFLSVIFAPSTPYTVPPNGRSTFPIGVQPAGNASLTSISTFSETT